MKIISSSGVCRHTPEREGGAIDAVSNKKKQERCEMKFLKIILITMMVFSFLGLNFPQAACAGQKILFARANAGITENAPEMRSLPEVDIPVETVKTEKKKRNKWLWGALGALVLGGGLAAGLGGSGGGGDGGDTGDVTVSW
jgi:hypothetical protein